jgi:hypothetical protein
MSEYLDREKLKSYQATLLNLEVITLTVKPLHENLKHLEIRENLLETHTLCKARECLGKISRRSVSACDVSGRRPPSIVSILR